MSLLSAKRIGWAMMVFAVMLGAGESAQAGLVYLSESNGELATYNTTTGKLTNIGNSGTALYDIGVTPNGTLYGVDGSSTSSLYTVSTTTAQLTRIGSTGTFLNALVGSTNTTLIGAGEDQVYNVSTSGGAATKTSSTIGGGYTSSGDLAFYNGTLYLTAADSSKKNFLLSINQATGAGTVIGNSNSGLGVDGVFGLATTDNVLYGFAGSNVYTVDTTNGKASYYESLNLEYGVSVLGAASAVVATPEPATMISAGIAGLIGLGYDLRRRKKATA